MNTDMDRGPEGREREACTDREWADRGWAALADRWEVIEWEEIPGDRLRREEEEAAAAACCRALLS